MSTWQPEERRSRRGPIVVVAAMLVVITVFAAAVAILMTRTSDETTSAASGSPTAPVPFEAAPGLVGAFSDLRWVSLNGVAVPTSTTLGPRDVDGGRARGFAHSEAGAIVAALNLVGRTSGLVPASVYTATIAEQTVGTKADRDALTEQANSDAGVLATASPGVFTEVVGYRLDSASPEEVSVTLVSRATGPTGSAVLAQQAEVRWVDGDWRYVLPARDGLQASTPPDGTAAFPGRSLNP